MAGQIINRGERTWLVRVYLGPDETGKRRYHNRTVHGNKKDAEGILTDLLKARNSGTLTVGSDSLLLWDLLEDVVRDYRINGQDAAWAKIVITRLKPAFGKMAVSTIRPKHIAKFIESRQAAGAANATINRDLSMLRRAFSIAFTKGTIGSIPFPIKTLAENNVRKGFFEHAEYVRLRAALPAHVKPILTFGYYTGCRLGEILGLQWSQIDLLGRMIRLEPGETKNDEARIIPLQVEDLYQTLAILRADRDEHFPTFPWVFSRGGKRILDIRKAWDGACEAAGLWDAATKHPTRLFHDLRRSGVRNLLRAGVPEKVAMRISGHKTRSVFDRYNIVDERDIVEGMRRLDVYSRERAAAEKAAGEKQSSDPHTIRTQIEKRH